MPNPPGGPSGPWELSRPAALPTAGVDDSALETVGQTVRHAAGALEGLKDILERLEASISKAVDQRRTEEQFGELFVRAQEYVDKSIAETEQHARILVAEAEREASRIIAAAMDEAQRLMEESRRSSRLPAEAARQLQATVESFGHVNKELLQELMALSQTLGAPGQLERTSQPSTDNAHSSVSSPSGQEQGASMPATETNTPQQAPSSGGGYWSRLRPAAATHSLRIQKDRPSGSPR